MDGRELTTLFDLSSNESSSSAAETKSCSEWEAQAACRESSYNCQIHCGWFRFSAGTAAPRKAEAQVAFRTCHHTYLRDTQIQKPTHKRCCLQIKLKQP